MASKGKPRAPENETKNEKFRRLAKTRLNAALGKISSIGGLASKSYDFSEVEYTAVVKALENEVVKLANKFNAALQPSTAAKKDEPEFDPFADIEAPKAAE